MMELQIALLDLLKEEKEFVDEINKAGYDAAYYEKRAEERKAGGTVCDLQASLDDYKKTKQLLEEEVRLIGRLGETRVKIRNYLKEVLLK